MIRIANHRARGGTRFLPVATEQQVPRLRSAIRQADAGTALGMTNLQLVVR